MEQENVARRIAESKNVILSASEARLGEELGQLEALAAFHEGQIKALKVERLDLETARRDLETSRRDLDTAQQKLDTAQRRLTALNAGTHMISL